MKKILIILALFAFAFTAQAQDLTIGSNDHFAVYTGVAGDTLDASTDLTVTAYLNKDYFYHVNVQVEADSAGTGADIAVKLQGSWDNTTFYDIGSTVTWYVTASDTTFSLNSFTALTETFTVADSVMSTAQLVTYTRNIPGLMYPYIRVYFNGASGADMLLTKLRYRIIKAN